MPGVPLRHTVEHRHFQPSTDSHGTQVDGWSEEQLVRVHGWSSTSMAQPIDGARRPVLWDVDLLAPAGTVCSPRDRWRLLGNQFEQVGHAEDYTTGPFRHPTAGLVVHLRRVEG